MGCASSAPPPQQNGSAKHYPQHQHQQPNHHLAPPPMHQPPPAQQAPPVAPVSQQQPVRAHPPPPAPTEHNSGVPPPPQKPAEPLIKEEDEAPPEPVELNQTVVNTLVELEHQINALERRNVIKQYELKEDQVKRLNQQIQAMVRRQQELEAKTQKEYQDVVNLSSNATVHQMMTQVQFAQQINKEQEEYMQALNTQEIHKKELEAFTKQLEALQQTVAPVKEESDELKQLYDKQDSLLASIFSGKYGSEKEYKVESDLDLMMERKQRIAVAKYKWTQSRTLLSHTVGQMAFGVRRWHDAVQVPPENAQLRYTFAAEARNNFVAASQNIASAQRYLSTIKFPYCTPQEVQTLNLAITHIFTDLLTVERHKHAMECYVTVYKRCAALVQWFDHVINKTILKDSEKATQECASLQKELKLERMRLIKEKVRESLGDEAAENIQVADDKPEEEKDEPEIAALAVIDADVVSQAGELAESDKNPENDANAPTPVPLDELAPAPNMDDIFGNIEQLKKQHEEQQQEYEKQQELAKARADQGLQHKLARRRSRRRRMQANEAEMQALNQDE